MMQSGQPARTPNTVRLVRDKPKETNERSARNGNEEIWSAFNKSICCFHFILSLARFYFCFVCKFSIACFMSAQSFSGSAITTTTRGPSAGQEGQKCQKSN